MPDDRLTGKALLLIGRPGCGIKIRRPTPSRQIGYGVKNPAADRMVGDDLPQNREK
jgi:hypothetical protein